MSLRVGFCGSESSVVFLTFVVAWQPGPPMWAVAIFTRYNVPSLL